MKTKRNFPLRPFDSAEHKMICKLHFERRALNEQQKLRHKSCVRFASIDTLKWAAQNFLLSHRWEKMKLLRYAFVCSRARLTLIIKSDNNSLIQQHHQQPQREISLSRNISSLTPLRHLLISIFTAWKRKGQFFCQKYRTGTSSQMIFTWIAKYMMNTCIIFSFKEPRFLYFYVDKLIFLNY